MGKDVMDGTPCGKNVVEKVQTSTILIRLRNGKVSVVRGTLVSLHPKSLEFSMYFSTQLMANGTLVII